MLYGAVCDKPKSSNRHQYDSNYGRGSGKIRVVVAGPVELHTNIQRFLPDRLYDVECIERRDELIETLDQRGCDLLIIDTSLNGLDGMADVRSLSLEANSYYIITYISNGDEVDKILALELGADDCLTSSCSTREIEARVRALLRRCANEKARLKIEQLNKNLSSADILYFSGWSINRVTFILTAPGGIEVYLPRAEYSVISELVRKPILVKGQKNLLKCTDDNGEPCNDRTIDSIISRIRKKLARFEGGNLIETVRGQGYRLSVPVTDLK